MLSQAACTNVFFHPSRVEFVTPEQLGLDYENVYLTVPNELQVHGWYLPARDEALGTILFLHGNAENISTHIRSVFWLPSYGFNVFLLDYRGYGHSEGDAGIEEAHADVEAAISYLVSRGGVDRNALVLFGQSLGGTIAIQAVANTQHRQHIKGLVTESAFSSYRDIAREKLAEFWASWPFQWPFSWLISDSYSPLKSIGSLKPLPIVIIHGDKDRIVPMHHAYRLFHAAQEPKQLWIEQEMGHIQTLTITKNREYFVTLIKQMILGERHAL